MRLSVEGLKCNSCVNTTEGLLTGVAGVVSAEVSLEKKMAVIQVCGVGRDVVEWLTTIGVGGVTPPPPRTPASSMCSRSMPQHPFFGAAHGGFEASCSMPQYAAAPKIVLCLW